MEIKDNQLLNFLHGHGTMPFVFSMKAMTYAADQLTQSNRRRLFPIFPHDEIKMAERWKKVIAANNLGTVHVEFEPNGFDSALNEFLLVEPNAEHFMKFALHGYSDHLLSKNSFNKELIQGMQQEAERWNQIFYAFWQELGDQSKTP